MAFGVEAHIEDLVETWEEEEIREALAERMNTLLSNYGSTLVGKAFDTIDPESRAEAVDWFTDLFAKALVDPANLNRIR